MSFSKFLATTVNRNIIRLILFVCVSVPLMCRWCPLKPEEGMNHLEFETQQVVKPLDMEAGNRTQVFS